MVTETLKSSQDFIELEDRHGAHNYHPLPVVLARGEGVYVWDVEGRQYFDFLSAYSAVNQGHGHPRILDALTEQAKQLALTSRAFHNDKLGVYEQYVTTYFGYDKVLPMNTGAEAVETAIKICRKWGYEKKGIPNGEAIVLVCGQNFHGRTITIISFSSDPDAKGHFGPYTPGFESIEYNSVEALRSVLEAKGERIAGILVEPIQGEAGVNVPDEDYMREISALCSKHNVLFIADEIQTGIARTGSLLATCGNCQCQNHCERDPQTYVRADMIILGKALSGGAYPVSAVLADNHIMEVITPGTHGSTYGGNPLACAVAMEALAVVVDEQLALNARRLGHHFRSRLQVLVDRFGILKSVRGKGLLNAILINDTPESSTAWELCLALKENGLLAKPTHGNIIRFAPPLVITEEQINECLDIIERTLVDFSGKE